MMEAQDKTFLVGLSNDIFLSPDKTSLLAGFSLTLGA
jgi:hypothetical protein